MRTWVRAQARQGTTTANQAQDPDDDRRRQHAASNGPLGEDRPDNGAEERDRPGDHGGDHQLPEDWAERGTRGRLPSCRQASRSVRGGPVELIVTSLSTPFKAPPPAPPIEWDLQRSVAPFSQHYLAWSHEFMIATGPQADRCVARAVLRQKVLEEDVAEDVENGLAAPSQGQMRPPWPYHTKEAQHDDPADGQRPHRCRRP